MRKKESGVRSRESERGFALLFVFLMAAVVGLYLYTQLPRVAFESERDKEQTLIDRGEQYKRAIQLYVAAVKKYPQKIEDLENTNNKRYLRKRYLDPMTGKDEWRLIHVNAAGQLTDSLVQKPPCGALGSSPGSNSGTGGSTPSSSTSGSTPSSGSSSSFSTSSFSTSSSTTSSSSTPSGGTTTGDCTATPSGAGTGTATASSTPAGATGASGAAATDPNDVNAAVRRRPSDVVGNAYTAPANADPNDPSTWAPITLAAPTGTANGQPPTGAVGFNGGLLGQNPGQPGANGQPAFPGQGGAPAGAFPLPGQPGFNPTQNQFKIDANGQLVPVTPAQPGQVSGTQPAAGSQPFGSQPQPSQPVSQQAFGAQTGGNGVNPGTGVAPSNAGTTAINQMLTNPNPAAGGLGTSAGMTTGGIAGVASMYKGPSIKIYGTRQKYQEWEFIFTMNNQQTGQPNNPLGGTQPGTTTPGQNGTAAGATGSTAPATVPPTPPPGN
ncbi:MAG: hypothetical protein ABSF22_20785 [Bryobacteraceae bacterium]